jgi:hypothetical protein
MSRKPVPLSRIAPLQHVVAEPVTDPAEQAALDALSKQQSPGQLLGTRGIDPGLAAPRADADLVELWRQLVPEAQFRLLIQLTAELPSDRRAEFLRQVAKHGEEKV